MQAFIRHDGRSSRPGVLCAVAFVLGSGAVAAGADVKLIEQVNRADVMRHELEGVRVIAMHEVINTDGRRERQAYTVLNHLKTGNSFIVISSESSAINGTVFIIKNGALFAAAPNQRSFRRLGALNLERRISGSLFSHLDLQGNLLLTQEYDVALQGQVDHTLKLLLSGKPNAQYKKIVAELNTKTGLFTKMELYDTRGLLKTAIYDKPRRRGEALKRRIPTEVTLRRADGRDDLPVPETRFVIYEVEFNPKVAYDALLSVSDQNLQSLRAKHVMSGDSLRSLLAELTN